MTRLYLLTPPEAFASGVVGPQDLLATDEVLLERITGESNLPAQRFDVATVGMTRNVTTAFERRVTVDRTLGEADDADVVYIPPLALMPDELHHFDPTLLEWLREQAARGAMVCSACTGTLLMAAAGILDGERATTHWAYADLFRRFHPEIELQVRRTLVVSGTDRQLVTAGAHASWHDLVLFLVHRYVGAAAARKTAKVFLLDWHDLDQTAYATFHPPMQHGDTAVLEAQEWLAANLAHPGPVDAVIERNRLSRRSFLRRFRHATGHTPIRYMQELRIDRAKTLLEESDDAVENIAGQVGYDDIPYFRRLFKRVTGITPAKYRKSFRTPPDVASLLG